MFQSHTSTVRTETALSTNLEEDSGVTWSVEGDILAYEAGLPQKTRVVHRSLAEMALLIVVMLVLVVAPQRIQKSICQ